MIEESYVSFYTAKLLKDAGFDIVCDHWYNDKGVFDGDCPKLYEAPTLALAERWLREENDTFVKMERVGRFDGKEFRFYWSYSIISVSTACLKSISGGRYDCYEEALEAGIAQVLERIIDEIKE